VAVTILAVTAAMTTSGSFHRTAETAKPHVVFWMHIQKTSSWIGNFLLIWGCSSLRKILIKKFDESAKYRLNGVIYTAVGNISQLHCEMDFYTGKFGFGYHIPFPQLNHLSHKLNGTTVSLFRQPSNRVISSFLHGKGPHAIMFPLGFPNRAKVKYSLREQIRASQFPILTYAELPGISGCQTKMILGRECGEVTSFKEGDLREAKRRLREDMLFVGLTEESNASAQLFMAMFGVSGSNNNLKSSNTSSDQLAIPSGKTFVDMYVPNMQILAPRRNSQHTNALNSGLRRTLQVHGWKDHHDEALFAEAARIFYGRCRQHGIRTKFTIEQLLAL